MNDDIDLEDVMPGEKEKAKKEIRRLPKEVRKFYVANYSIGNIPGFMIQSNPEGLFVGLVCKVCRRWRQYKHDVDCPVGKLEPKNAVYHEYKPESEPEFES